MKDLSKHFYQDQDRRNWITLFSSFGFFFYLLYVYPGIPFSVLDEFRPVSAQAIICKSSLYDCWNVEIFILEAQETFPGTLKVNMINVLCFFVIYKLYLNYKYNAKLTAESQVINHRHKILQQCYSSTDVLSENLLLSSVPTRR